MRLRLLLGAVCLLAAAGGYACSDGGPIGAPTSDKNITDDEGNGAGGTSEPPVRPEAGADGAIADAAADARADAASDAPADAPREGASDAADGGAEAASDAAGD